MHTPPYPSTPLVNFFNCWVCKVWGLLGKVLQWFWETRSHSFLQNSKIPKSQKCTTLWATNFFFFFNFSLHYERAGIALNFSVIIPTFRRKQWKMFMSPYGRIELFTFLWGYKWKICVGWIPPWASELCLWKNVSHAGRAVYSFEHCTVIGNKSLFPFSTHTYFPILGLCHNCSLFSSHLFFIISWRFSLYYCCFSNSWQYVQIALMSVILTAV